MSEEVAVVLSRHDWLMSATAVQKQSCGCDCTTTPLQGFLEASFALPCYFNTQILPGHHPASKCVLFCSAYGLNRCIHRLRIALVCLSLSNAQDSAFSDCYGCCIYPRIFLVSPIIYET